MRASLDRVAGPLGQSPAGRPRPGAYTPTGYRRASAGNLTYTVTGTGKGMPITEFPVSASARSPVTAHPFKRSFKTSAKGLLRAHLGSGRLPIRGLNGPAVSKEIVQGETAAHFWATAAPRMERAVM